MVPKAHVSSYSLRLRPQVGFACFSAPMVFMWTKSQRSHLPSCSRTALLAWSPSLSLLARNHSTSFSSTRDRSAIQNFHRRGFGRISSLLPGWLESLLARPIWRHIPVHQPYQSQSYSLLVVDGVKHCYQNTALDTQATRSSNRLQSPSRYADSTHAEMGLRLISYLRPVSCMYAPGRTAYSWRVTLENMNKGFGRVLSSFA